MIHVRSSRGSFLLLQAMRLTAYHLFLQYQGRETSDQERAKETEGHSKGTTEQADKVQSHGEHHIIVGRYILVRAKEAHSNRKVP